MGKVTKTDDQWRAELDSDVYEITRQAATEPPFSGKYCDTKTPGVYNCTCCGAALFDSDTKYDSRSGWPSFYTPISEDVVSTEEDNSMAMQRVEVRCAECDSHLGHVFPDGPQPTGLRYCLNSASLDLKEKAE
ncbi:MAG: peptide-methionine (R)-S-oxide reductase MsrB [Pseudomonadales bacterium]|jgi:peptide-methionine (R)-S-oxide reductase